jgi:hypothetical protein
VLRPAVSSRVPERPPGHGQSWLLLCRAQARAQTPTLQTIGKDDPRARRAAFSGHLLRQGQAGALLSRRAPSW